MQRPSLLAKEEPYNALCHHFNVSADVPVRELLPATVDMVVLRDAQTPTHVIAAFQANGSPSTYPLMLPIDINSYERGFRVGLDLPDAPPGTTAPIPRELGSSQTLVVTLPVISLTVPHTGSLPLLLLYGLGLETQPNLLAWRLLPSQVVEEFPNAAAMAQNFARLHDDDFGKFFGYNQGLWKNILALGLTDTRTVELVQTAWNVTAEARRIRQRSTPRR